MTQENKISSKLDEEFLISDDHDRIREYISNNLIEPGTEFKFDATTNTTAGITTVYYLDSLRNVCEHEVYPNDRLLLHNFMPVFKTLEAAVLYKEVQMNAER